MTRQLLVEASLEDLDNEDRVRVLGIIDQFRELGIQVDVSLPQLVVVGDHSSGKSSLLERLTGLSIPIASDPCTRFATQIVLRRSLEGEDAIKVSILPGSTANNDEEQTVHLQRFARTIEGAELNSDVFAAILDEAATHMGLPAASGDYFFEDVTRGFSGDVLRIELSSPEHHHFRGCSIGSRHFLVNKIQALTLADPTKHQTQEILTSSDHYSKHIYRTNAPSSCKNRSYTASERRLIGRSVEINARNNIANQEIFQRARSADLVGKRTVGIITKCDALQAGDESMVMKIAQNGIEPLDGVQ